LWIAIGTGFFILIGFILPTPQSLVEIMEKYGYVQKVIDWEIAQNAREAAAKTMIVLGIVPMAVVFFAVEALPIGATGILMPLLAYFCGRLTDVHAGRFCSGINGGRGGLS
jgi:sodium-dependent dicarboxylate transporter 2/3/5